MRKRKLYKDIRKCFSKSKGRFISIMCLMALGSFALVGLKAAGPDMRETGRHYFDRLNLADISIIGDYGIDEENQSVINGVSGANKIEYGYLKDAAVKDTTESFRIFSNTEEVSVYEIVKGRLPRADNEIALASFYSGKYNIGDKICFDEKADITGEKSLKYDEFTVVGFVNSPEFLSFVNMGQSTAGSGELKGYAVVDAAAFNSDYYMIARLTFSDLADIDPYSDEYSELLQHHKDELNALLKEQPGARLAAVKSEYQSQIDEGQKKIDDARRSISDAEQQLDDAKVQIDDASRQINDSQIELNNAVANAQAKIGEGEVQIKYAEADFAGAKLKINAAGEQLVDAENQIKEKEDELSAAKMQIRKSEVELSQKRTEIQLHQQEYDAARAELLSAKAELDEFKNKLESGKSTYEAGIEATKNTIDTINEKFKNPNLSDAWRAELKKQLSTAEKKLSAVQAEYKEYIKNTYTPGIAALQSSEQMIAEKNNELSEARILLDKGWQQLFAAETELNIAKGEASQGETQLNAAKAELESKRAEYNEGNAKLSASDKELDKKRGELEAAKAALDSQKKEGERKISSAKAQLDEKIKDYEAALDEFNTKKSDADKEIAEGDKKLSDARKMMNSLEMPTYALDSRRELPGAEGYTVYDSVASIIDKLANVFPIFLYFVAALVTLTTMTRFVDEERTNSGTLKALGYNDRDVIKKFTIYGLISGVIGALVGIAAGHTLLPMIVYAAYGSSFTLPKIELHFHLGITIIAIALALISAVLPAYLVSEKELREKPSSLLQPKSPAAGSKILLEHIRPIWNRMSFTHKVTARNIFRYKKRMLMTIFGVCGSVTLLFAGFSVQNSISEINERQFGDIIKYDMIVAKFTGISGERENEINQLLASSAVSRQLPIRYEEMGKIAGKSNDRQSIKLIVPQDDGLKDYISLVRRTGGDELNLQSDGVIISERLAKLLDVKTGEKITVTDDENNERTMTVSGICEMYIGHFIFMDAEYYKEVFGKEYTSNANLVTLADGSMENVNNTANEFMKLAGVQSVVQNTTLINQINTIVSSLDMIMQVLIIVAVLLAVVILYNLTNINVSERIRELSTIKVLGFYDKEVTMYIYRETILLTILGILVGFGFGDALYQYILAVVPPEDVMFDPALGAIAFIVPVAVIMVITVLLGLIINRKLKNIDMLEALKSVE
ncbi:MAG TPA: FtsX-like permease family protein [Firmicutes bacterium]|nr:FtsX-like permease family protein [Bacillota bacterium]